MIKRFDNYNDNELIYLIREGSEFALNYLFKKYDVLIYKIATKYYDNGDKFDDLLQEGRMILYSCINSYDFNRGASFYSFFSVCLKRRYMKLINDDDYYSSTVLCEDLGLLPDSKHLDYTKLYSLSRKLKNTEFYDMFNECIIENLPLALYAKKNNISYSICYRKYCLMLKKLKNLLT